VCGQRKEGPGAEYEEYQVVGGKPKVSKKEAGGGAHWHCLYLNCATKCRGEAAIPVTPALVESNPKGKHLPAPRRKVKVKQERGSQDLSNKKRVRKLPYNHCLSKGTSVSRRTRRGNRPSGGNGSQSKALSGGGNGPGRKEGGG